MSQLIREDSLVRYIQVVGMFLAACVLMVLNGCGTTYKREPLPEIYGDSAEIDGMPKVRYWGDERPKSLDAVKMITPEKLKARYPKLYGVQHNYLAISGGGADGAFGAGLLAGWTEAGTRPEFALVTGISTGSLMAPFAFLGPKYDHVLEALYTTLSTKDLVRPRPVLSALFSHSAMDVEPLKALMEKYVTPELVAEVGREYMKGRSLLIGTTNLDAGRPVIWSMGRIASSGHPDSVELFRSIMLASASIPVVFPPVYIKVKAGGYLYDEMHVDGGTAAQVFLYPMGLNWTEVKKLLAVTEDPNLFIIRNAHLRPKWEPVKSDLGGIAKSSISSLIRTQGVGDLYQVYLACERDGINYNLAYIPDEFDADSNELFDPEYMKKLYKQGYDMAVSGYPWKPAPPTAGDNR